MYKPNKKRESSYLLLCKELTTIDNYIKQYESILAQNAYYDLEINDIDKKNIKQQLEYMQSYRSILRQRKNDMLVLAYLET